MDDIEEIRKLKARYFRALDTKDWDLYRSVFADDVVVDMVHCGGPAYHGIDEFMAYARSLTIVQSVHQGHMPEIELTGPTTATGVWALEDYNIWEDGHQNHGWGHYLETYEKQGDRWRIKTMKLSYLRIEQHHAAPWVAGKDKVDHLRGSQPAAR